MSKQRRQQALLELISEYETRHAGRAYQTFTGTWI